MKPRRGVPLGRLRRGTRIPPLRARTAMRHRGDFSNRARFPIHCSLAVVLSLIGSMAAGADHAERCRHQGRKS